MSIPLRIFARFGQLGALDAEEILETMEPEKISNNPKSPLTFKLVYHPWYRYNRCTDHKRWARDTSDQQLKKWSQTF